MRYRQFRIRNFKGIKDTTVNFDSATGVSVFAFVGLNESGKTTILEAIHSYSPDSATSDLLGGKDGVPVKNRVPRHLISTFTGNVSVEATIALSEDDKKHVASAALRDEQIIVDVDRLPDEVVLERCQTFSNGDFQQAYFDLKTELYVKVGRAKRWHVATMEERRKLRDIIHSAAPDIAYFPTFVFDFPDYVFLTRNTVKDQFYTRVFQDILDFDGHGHSVDKDIVRRVRAEKLVTAWTAFLSLWSRHEDKAKIQHVIDRASRAVTRLVFGRWDRIFKEKTRGKEIEISYDVFEGTVTDKSGAVSKTHEHDVAIMFEVKDGTRRFNVNNRSLGFRWFFAFMLFTQFRVTRTEADRPVLFLFDEPASNLHAAAQQRLIECFPEIARDGHMLAYSTHSHYMIEPKWLEQTFIVTNRADAPSDSVIDETSLDDESLDIKVATYRAFVNAHPNQTNYFQPILDRLEVIPSNFDFKKPSVVVEGKSDYYLLRYAAKALGLADTPLIPAFGASTFDTMASFHVGWNLDLLFLLDGDRAGAEEKSRYAKEYGIAERRLMLLNELHPEAVQIEDILDASALNIIREELQLTKAPNKGQIRRYFQEHLASNTCKPLGIKFAERGKSILTQLGERLQATAS